MARSGRSQRGLDFDLSFQLNYRSDFRVKIKLDTACAFQLDRSFPGDPTSADMGRISGPLALILQGLHALHGIRGIE
jgi:hypothetical protein